MTQIAPGVFSMKQIRVVTCTPSSRNGTDLTLIDTLFETDARQILERIESIGRTIADLKRIVLTHGHRFPSRRARHPREALGANVYSHEWRRISSLASVPPSQ